MKIFSEFIDEALIASLVKAAARQIFKSRGLQKGITKVGKQAPKAIKLPSKVTGFQTARGSKYTYEKKPGSWPTTQRTAVHDPYHPTPAGKTQKSTATMFTTPDASLEMKRRFQYEPKTPYHQGLPLSKKPGIGKAPVEVFNKYDKLGDRSAIHAGNPITDLKTKLPGPKNNIGLFGSQRKELKTRVNTALQNPNNLAVLKKEMGMKEDYRKTFGEFITEAAKRIEMVKLYHGSPKSAADKIKKSGFDTSEVHASTSHDVARSFGQRKGENKTNLIQMQIPKKHVKSDAPAKALKTQGQRATDNWGREHFSVIMSPGYASKHMQKYQPIIQAPRTLPRYRDQLPKAFRQRTRTKPKKK